MKVWEGNLLFYFCLPLRYNVDALMRARSLLHKLLAIVFVGRKNQRTILYYIF